MTAFELCRQRPDLELAPVLRIVKYLGLDSANLGDAEVGRIVALHPHFREDPEMIVGLDQIGERTGLDAATVTGLLHERRRDIPFLGTPSRPMVPRVSLQLLRDAARGTVDDDAAEAPATAPPTAPPEPRRRADADRIAALESEVQAALDQVRSLSRTLSNISRRVQQTRSLPRRSDRHDGLRRHRRNGGGRPDTIVEACRKVLEEADRPLKVADITERVLSHGVAIRAKNPNVTISSILSSYEVFERVRRGYYTLADSIVAPPA